MASELSFAVGAYWSVETEAALRQLRSGRTGLTSADAASRLSEVGPNRVREADKQTRLRVFSKQFENPLLLILLFAAAASVATQEWVDASIVLTVVMATVAIGYSREYNAASAAAALQARIQIRTKVLRDGQIVSLPAEDVVPGDIVQLAAGSLVPADGLILEAADFFVSEAALTGESFPVEKRPGRVAVSAALRERLNCVFLGTNVRSGTASCLIATTGARTEFGAIAHGLAEAPPATDFDRGLRRFGYFLTSAMLVMVFVVFLVHLLNHRPPIETLLFSVRGCRSEPGASASHLECQPGTRRPDDGARWCARPSSQRYREPWKPGHPGVRTRPGRSREAS